MSKNPIYFMDYDKISDQIIYFSQYIRLSFNVQLGYKSTDGEQRFFHREISYSKYRNRGNSITIKRNMNFFFTIDDTRDYKNGVMITIQDIFFIKTIIEKNVLQWFIGENSIYGRSPDDNKLIITGQWRPQHVILSDYKFLEFQPITIEYEDGKTNYGIRMIINDPSNFVDMDLNKFMAFYYIISNTDMYAVACSMVEYVKTMPYGINHFDMNNGFAERPKNFFDNL